MTDAWTRARRILAVRLDAMGDVLMTAPALAALANGPARPSITLLTSPAGAAAAKLLPCVDQTLVWRAPWMKHDAAAEAPDFGAMATLLQDLHFDAAVVFTVHSQSALPAALLLHEAGIPLRAAHCRENPYRLLTEWLPEPEPQRFVRHEVRRQLDLVGTLGFPCRDERIMVDVPAAARAEVRLRLAQAGLDDAPGWFVAHAGASAPSRIYPPEKMALALGRIHRASGLVPVLTGGGHEIAPLSTHLASEATPSVSLADGLNLSELAALLQMSRLLVANNTGPVHLAAGVGSPVVVTYALTNPQHTPWRVPSRVLFHDVPCRWCQKSRCPRGTQDCLRSVPSRRVAAAALELLGLAPPRPQGWPALPA